MKKINFHMNTRIEILSLAVVLTLTAQAGSRLMAADKAATATNSASTEAPDYKNWVEVGAGGVMMNGGDKAQFRKQHNLNTGAYGGIDDLHMQQDVGKGLFSVDGRAIFDNDDYKIKMELSQPDIGYIKSGFEKFRTWYDGNGGYFPTSGRQFNGLENNNLYVDRGQYWVEMGLRLPEVPDITMRYSHEYREGNKDSTLWTSSSFTGTGSPGSAKFVPAYRNLDEARDIVTLDAKHTYGNTDVELGMRYEFTDNKQTIYMNNSPDQATATRTEQMDNFKSDLFSGHGSTVTRFNDKLWLTVGYAYSAIDGVLDGRRTPAAYTQLGGKTWDKQHVANMNVLWMPIEGLSITPEIRIQHDATDGNINYNRTGAGNPNAIVITRNELLTVAEGLEARYNGLADWVFYARADVEEESGQRQDSSNSDYNNTATRNLNLDADTTRLRQKYTVGTNWYPLPKLNFAAQYYYKYDEGSQNFIAEDTIASNPLDNQRMLRLRTNTDDVNWRATWRPLNNLSLVSRYDFQFTKITSQWRGPNSSTTGLVAYAADGMSSEMTNHVFSECITLNPCSRMYLQADGSYVLNTLHTPASMDLSPNIIQDGRNSYWTLGGGVGITIDDKTDLKGDYVYYQSNNFDTGAAFAGMPYGASAQEHTVSAVLSHRLSQAVSLSLKYGYFKYQDTTSGEFNNYEGHMVYASTKVKF